MEFSTGEIYERPCAIIRMDDGREYAIPVFNHRHSDAQFGFPHEHYHIDCRFYIEPRMGHEYQVHRGHTAAVIRVNGKSPRFLRLELQSVACVGHETGLAFPAEPSLRQRENLIKYEEWYDSYVGRSCAGKRCPHFGTEMLEKDGMLVCPLHELKADLVTMVVVCRGD